MGAEADLVGSLRTGLLMKHRDIDFHIYSSPLRVADSFAAMARLAENPRIRRIEYGNLLDAQDQCLEWHAWYADADERLWQIDMIHMPRGSAWDGYFERAVSSSHTGSGTAPRRPANQVRHARRGEDHGHRILPGGPSRRRAHLCRVRSMACGEPRRGHSGMDAVSPPETPLPCTALPAGIWKALNRKCGKEK